MRFPGTPPVFLKVSPLAGVKCADDELLFTLHHGVYDMYVKRLGVNVRLGMFELVLDRQECEYKCYSTVVCRRPIRNCLLYNVYNAVYALLNDQAGPY